MEQKKAMLEALIANMRKKMLDGKGDEALDPGEAVGKAESEIGEGENSDKLEDVLETEQQELSSGEDLDGDGKAGDPELIAAIKKYMSGDNGGAGMKAGPLMGAFGASSSPRKSDVAPTPTRKFGSKK